MGGDDYAERTVEWGLATKEAVAAAADDIDAVWLDVRSEAEVQEDPLPRVRAPRIQCPVWCVSLFPLSQPPTALCKRGTSATPPPANPHPPTLTGPAANPRRMDEANDLAEAAPQLLPSKEAPIICFCAVGGRASTAKKALDALGYTNVINAGGLADVRALAESLTAEGRLARLGTELPELAAIGRYVPYRLVGNMLYVSGSSARPRYQTSPPGSGKTCP